MFRIATRALANWLAIPGLLVTTAGHAELVDGEDLIDPTAPFLLDMDVGTTTSNMLVTSGTYEVSSILVRNNLRVAVINSQRVREGEYVGNAQLLSIGTNTVTINLGGVERILSLHGAAIKTRSGN